MRLTMNHTGLAHSVADACSIAGIGRTSLYEAIHDGELRAVKSGRRTLILHSDLLRWLQSLPPVNAAPQSNDQGKYND
jgi:excisionase family DNA binding protein